LRASGTTQSGDPRQSHELGEEGASLVGWSTDENAARGSLGAREPSSSYCQVL
jgi:hypothetical protein